MGDDESRKKALKLAYEEKSAGESEMGPIQPEAFSLKKCANDIGLRYIFKI